MNTGTFAGYLGRDAEMRSTPSGKQVLNYSVAVSVGFGDKKETLWVACAQWGTNGEKLAPYLVKGTAVCISGDVGIRTYEKKDGTTVAELTLNVQRVTLLGKGGAKAEPAAKPAAQKAAQNDFDDDIPF